MIRVPYDQLDPQTLAALIEEFVTRDGAVQGHQDRSNAQRIESVMKQLQSGKVVIVFDEADESCTIVSSEKLPPGGASDY
jgi:uncharacterized protein YheU (UPF0270 family)